MREASQAEQQRRAFVDVLDRQQLEERVRALAATGLTERDIAEMTALHQEQVCRVLGKRQERRT